MMILCVLLSACFFIGSSNALAGNSPTTYRYFAYGSNMAESTLTGLRSVSPLESSAAILPGYRLRFNLSVFPGVGTAAACVEKCNQELDAVHGVVYTLTPQDFARVGFTESVPFAYKWERCMVYPYVGNGARAGHDAMKGKAPVSAFTLVATFPDQNKNDLPSSKGYLDILKKAGTKWQLDESYMEKLKATPIQEDGTWDILKFAERIGETRLRRPR